MRIRRISVSLICCLPLHISAATYYIDFSSGSDSNDGAAKATPWKRAPGMSAFTGTYIHASGDQFIFRGGVIWPDPASANWRIANSGVSTMPDYYGVDKTWYSGASWSQPVFDGGSQNPVTYSPYWLVTASYITMDNLRVQNIGVPNVNQGNYGIQFHNDHDILIENMTVAENSRIALMVEANTGTTLSNFTFQNNDISECSWGISVQATAANTVMNAVTIHDSVFHDFHSQIAGAMHADGVFLGSSGTVNQYVSNVLFYNNTMYGDWTKSDTSAAGVTGLFYCSSCGNSITIFNNHGTDAGSTSGYVFEINENTFPQGAVAIYNNSFSMDEAGGWEGFVYDYHSTGLRLENNIYAGGATVLYLPGSDVAAALVSNYNDFYGWTVSGTMANVAGTLYSYAGYKGHGYEANGSNFNPLFISSVNLNLQPGSPAIGAATNLYSIFTTDAGGNPRPASGAWSMGAYQAQQRPNPPSSLNVNIIH